MHSKQVLESLHLTQLAGQIAQFPASGEGKYPAMHSHLVGKVATSAAFALHLEQPFSLPFTQDKHCSLQGWQLEASGFG